MRVARELQDNITMVRENFVASLIDYTGQVAKENPDGYRAQAEAEAEGSVAVVAEVAQAVAEAGATLTETRKHKSEIPHRAGREKLPAAA